MQQLPDRPGAPPQAALIKRSARWALQWLRSPAALDGLSWLAWLLTVGGFAIWTLFHYHLAARPPWIGLTIRTSVFASWMLVLREWLGLRLKNQQADRPRGSRLEEDRP
jgi:hypothetical protein